MLEITLPETEYFDSANSVMVRVPSETVRLEHSLLSLSKWESKHNKIFIGEKNLEPEELLDYYKCMVIAGNPEVVNRFRRAEFNLLTDYINSSQTATSFRESNRPPGPPRERITSELIYYWMTEFNIPFSAETWHLNRLVTLIRVCSVKKTPPKKMSKGDLLRRNHELNQQRLAQYGTRG